MPRARVCAPHDLYVAAQTNEIGVVVHATGPFTGAADAWSHIRDAFGGQGYPVPLELALRSPRRPARRYPPAT